MGTNYYLKRNKCEHCGQSEEKIHIGKSSVGCKFLFRVDDTHKTVDDWLKDINNIGYVINEYEDVMLSQLFIDLIVAKSVFRTQSNSSNKITTDGSYDYLEGEFS